MQFQSRAGLVEMQQVVGVAARRIEFWPRPDDRVAAGDRVGIMKFGPLQRIGGVEKKAARGQSGLADSGDPTPRLRNEVKRL